MKKGICMGCLPGETVDDKFKLAKETGFDGVELPGNGSGEDVAAWKSVAGSSWVRRARLRGSNVVSPNMGGETTTSTRPGLMSRLPFGHLGHSEWMPRKAMGTMTTSGGNCAKRACCMGRHCRAKAEV